MAYGSLETARELLDIEPGIEDEKITRFLNLSNTWLNTLAPTDILDSLSSDTKNMAINFHTAFLFRLTAEKFSGEENLLAVKFKDEGKELIEQAIHKGSEPFEIEKVNKY